MRRLPVGVHTDRSRAERIGRAVLWNALLLWASGELHGFVPDCPDPTLTVERDRLCPPCLRTDRGALQVAESYSAMDVGVLVDRRSTSRTSRVIPPA